MTSPHATAQPVIEATGTSSRIRELDGLRGLAILSVFVHHALAVPLLWAGVDLFFVLSGFLITGILLKRKVSGGSFFGYFYERRARRILLPYSLLLAVSSILFGTDWLRYWYWYAFFGTNIGAARLEVGHPSLGALWSLAVEEQFYLVWPFLVLFLSAKWLTRFAFVGLLAAPLLRAAATPFFQTHYPIYFLTPFRLDLLCAGALLAILWQKSPSTFQRLVPHAWTGFAVSTCLLLFLYRYPYWRTASNTVHSNAVIYSLLVLMASSLVAIALSRTGPFCRLMRYGPLCYIGMISYSMYLIHQTVLAVVKGPGLPTVFSFAIAFGLTILYASVSWFAIERRLLGHFPAAKA